MCLLRIILFLLYNRKFRWATPLSSQYHTLTIVAFACASDLLFCVWEREILGRFGWGCCTSFCLRHRKKNLAPHPEQQRDIDSFLAFGARLQSPKPRKTPRTQQRSNNNNTNKQHPNSTQSWDAATARAKRIQSARAN